MKISSKKKEKESAGMFDLSSRKPSLVLVRTSADKEVRKGGGDKEPKHGVSVTKRQGVSMTMIAVIVMAAMDIMHILPKTPRHIRSTGAASLKMETLHRLRKDQQLTQTTMMLPWTSNHGMPSA